MSQECQSPLIKGLGQGMRSNSRSTSPLVGVPQLTSPLHPPYCSPSLRALAGVARLAQPQGRWPPDPPPPPPLPSLKSP